MIKINKKTSIGILVIVAVQILLLINMTPAESYIIGEANILENNLIVNDKKGFDGSELIKKSVGLFVGLISIKQIGIVSADAASDAAAAEALANLREYCCVETTRGATCQPTTSETYQDQCPGNMIPTSCGETTECNKGCCVDSTVGTCTKGAVESKCDGEGQTFKRGDEECAINECRTGCCVMGSTYFWGTNAECTIKSLSLGAASTFSPGESESKCLSRYTTNKKGACVLASGLVSTCKFETQTECTAESGILFKEGILCTNPELHTICKPSTNTKCNEGDHKVYFLDSCNNQANVYDTAHIVDASATVTDNYWKEVITTDLCEGSFTTCGNCNAPQSSCYEYNKKVDGEANKPDKGNNVCRDLNCPGAPTSIGEKATGGQDRKNGDSWCIYDGGIGKPDASVDPVGSEHFLAACVNGEVQITQSLMRDQVCQETTINAGTAQEFKQALLVPNQATSCLIYNSKYKNNEELRAACVANAHCRILDRTIDKYFAVFLCVPRYPRGMDFGIATTATGTEETGTTAPAPTTTDSGKTNSEIRTETCRAGTITCKVSYIEENFKWKNKANGGCEDKGFGEEMNRVCTSIGDCGIKVNYAGIGTNDGGWISSTGGPKDHRARSIPSSLPKWEEYIDWATPTLSQQVDPLSGMEDIIDTTTEDVGDISGHVSERVLKFDKGISMAGFKKDMANAFADSSNPALKNGEYTGYSVLAWIYAYINVVTFPISFLIVFWKGVIQSAFNVNIKISLQEGFQITGPSKPRSVTYECKPWEPPAVGDCSACNALWYKPCSKYRCESLGKNCRVFNDGTTDENPPCIDVVNKDDTSPVIVLAEGGIDESKFKYTSNADNTEAELKASDNKCISQYDNVKVVLDTKELKDLATLNKDEYSTCKWDLQSTANYDAMTGFIDEGPAVVEHTFEFSMLDDILNSEEYSGLNIDDNNFNIYIRCKNFAEISNLQEYIIKSCVDFGDVPLLVDKSKTIFDPVSESYVAADTTTKNVNMWIDRDSECKWSRDENADYEVMEGIFTRSGTKDFNGYLLTTTFTDIIAGENKFYIKCQTIKADGSGDVNREPTEYVLYGSQGALTIDSAYLKYNDEFNELELDTTTPSVEVKTNLEVVSIEVGLKTSGGADGDGVASCSWGTSTTGFRAGMKESNSNQHKQQMPIETNNPERTIYFDCLDGAGNTVKTSVIFKISLDNLAPNITRIWTDAGKLKIRTNEDAECKVDSVIGCGFDYINNGTDMTAGAFAKEHSISYTKGNTYYIKCKDVFGNVDSICQTTILPNIFVKK